MSQQPVEGPSWRSRWLHQSWEDEAGDVGRDQIMQGFVGGGEALGCYSKHTWGSSQFRAEDPPSR